MLNGLLQQTPLVSRWISSSSQRGIRSVVSSVYDPFGLAAPFVLPAKQLLQDSCRMKLQWDNPVPSEQKVYWEKWLVDIPNLSQFSVGRCIKPVGLNVISSSQLHHFSDASEVGLDQFPISVLSTTNATFIAPPFAVVTVSQKSTSSLQMNSYNHMPEKTALSQKNNLHI